MGAMRRGVQRDPLGPLSFVVTLATNLLVVGLVALPVVALTGGKYAFGAWGVERPCVDVSSQGLWVGSSDGAGYVSNRRPDVTEGTPQGFRLCQEGMDSTTRTLFAIPAALDLLWVLGFLGPTQRLIRRAGAVGLFSGEVARRVTVVGWYLLVGHVVVNVVSAVSAAFGTSRLVTEYLVWAGALGGMQLSWSIVIAACGVLSVGRIMSRSVQMREDLDGTV